MTIPVCATNVWQTLAVVQMICHTVQQMIVRWQTMLSDKWFVIQ